MLEIGHIGALTAFGAGIISFLSPCVLPLVPGYVSYVAGRTAQQPAETRRLATVGLSAFFVLGFSTVFILLGAAATALGQLLLAYRYELNLVGGAIVILFGLFMIGLPRPLWLQRDLRVRADPRGVGPASAYLLGLAFGFGWTPCIGPVLGAILTVSAATASISHGVALLAIYALGLGVPFLLAAGFLDAFMRRLKGMRRVGRPLQIAGGGVMVLMGLAMVTGQLSAFSYWLLETFPALGEIG